MMKQQKNSMALSDSKAAENLADEEWVALHAPRFGRIARPMFKRYSKFLDDVLEQGIKRIVPTAVVDVRTKTLPSFAEKILRNRGYCQDPRTPLPPDPIVRLTDLCGGRVIAQTADDVKRICAFIESAFEVDRERSEDVSKRLQPNQFGYRSIHYIVQVNPRKLRKSNVDVEIPAGLLGFKEKDLGPHAAGRPLVAEIQVRTFLEHASASLSHDALYKTDLKVPDHIRREHARLAAMLESVDSGFGRMLRSLKEFESSAGAHHDRKAVLDEISRLQIVLEQDPENVKLAVRIARHAIAVGEHEVAVKLLTPRIQSDRDDVLRMLGQALTEMHDSKPSSAGYRKGCRLLEQVCALHPKDAETLRMFAETVARKDASRARALFHEAISEDDTEPGTLARYLEFEIANSGNLRPAKLCAPMIRDAMKRCHSQIGAGVNLPLAWSSLAFFSLLSDKPFDALEAMAHLGTLCHGHETGDCKTGSKRRPCSAGRELRRLNEALHRVQGELGEVDGYSWCQRAVKLLLASRVADKQALEEVRELSSWCKGGRTGRSHIKENDHVVIFAGACSPALNKAVSAVGKEIVRGCDGLSFKLLCGGTRSGISRVAGDVAEKSDGKILAYGYLPKSLPRGSTEDTKKSRFARRFSSDGTDFTPLDPLQGWTDLIAAGVDARKVKVLMYAGGVISRAECTLALALGARVGIIDDPKLPIERQFMDEGWQGQENLIRLPIDAMTFRAFLLVNNIPVNEQHQQRLEQAAMKAHEDYVASATPRDPSLKKWKDLSDDLKLSNYHQVAYWEEMLKEYGMRVRKLPKGAEEREPISMVDAIGQDAVLELAEKEHGRWNVERLLMGWNHAPDKDVSKKVNPCLAPWTAITDVHGTDYQTYDVEAVVGLPKKLHMVGLELVKV